MNLYFDNSLIDKYHSSSQIARILTESWVAKNVFCPRCGNPHIYHFNNNQPVADFYCPQCQSQYELKSKNGILKGKVSDGAYKTMIERITSDQNPDFFFMEYSRELGKVINFMVIPKHFFIPEVIERRNPLSSTARRAGWVGCNILLDHIPQQGRIFFIKDSVPIEPQTIINNFSKSNSFYIKKLPQRCWMMDILICINQIPEQTFSLHQVYAFENILQQKHPDNHHIRPKIRQQLQILRDRGLLIFLGDGRYQKIK